MCWKKTNLNIKQRDTGIQWHFYRLSVLRQSTISPDIFNASIIVVQSTHKYISINEKLNVDFSLQLMWNVMSTNLHTISMSQHNTWFVNKQSPVWFHAEQYTCSSGMQRLCSETLFHWNQVFGNCITTMLLWIITHSDWHLFRKWWVNWVTDLNWVWLQHLPAKQHKLNGFSDLWSYCFFLFLIIIYTAEAEGPQRGPQIMLHPWEVSSLEKTFIKKKINKWY